MKILGAVLFSVLALGFTVHADTLDISGTAHLVAPGLNENFATSFLFNTDTLAVSDMSFSDSGTYTGFYFFKEVTFGTPAEEGFLFTGYEFAWDDPDGNQIGIGIPFTLNPTSGDIDFTSVFCRQNCLLGEFGLGILVPASSPGSTGTVQVSEASPIATPELSTGATLLLGLGGMFLFDRLLRDGQSRFRTSSAGWDAQREHV